LSVGTTTEIKGAIERKNGKNEYKDWQEAGGKKN